MARSVLDFFKSKKRIKKKDLKKNPTNVKGRVQQISDRKRALDEIMK